MSIDNISDIENATRCNLFDISRVLDSNSIGLLPINFG